MQKAAIVFPHQLFYENPVLHFTQLVYLVEETLYFNQFSFHKQKLAFQRASMKYYQQFLEAKGTKVIYIEARDEKSDIRILLENLSDAGIKEIFYVDSVDNWLEKRISKSININGMAAQKLISPQFVNTDEDLDQYFSGVKKYFQTNFYIYQRKKRNLLVEKGGKPMFGKWSFDAENRQKYPKGKLPPKIQFPLINPYIIEAQNYVERNFNNNYGNISDYFIFPVTHADAEKWLRDFLINRFVEFGVYEDAIVDNEHILNHSVLTPLLNTGLLTPAKVVDKAVDYALANGVPFNSLEGFVRQIIGWREFIRAIYIRDGSLQRTTNFWNFERKIPASFYNGTTGIEPIDKTIRKVLTTGYCHHIERLMILGNFMLLCEFDPNEVYRWFMELFIDAYDWVMVPNVYGMSQFADGGLMSTKPYISSSNYLLKMSNYRKNNDWGKIWDGLFWRFMHRHRQFFSSNQRLDMLLKTFDKMDEDKKSGHLHIAENFLAGLV